MPIKISNELPAYKTLTEENIFVMTETRATTQDIRPLRIAIVNRYGDPASAPAGEYIPAGGN